jgi:hypothetical protein
MLRTLVLTSIALACGVLSARNLYADSPEQVVEGYSAQARAEDPSFAGFSAERGEVIYREPHVIKGAGVWSCASCHLKDPRYSVRAHRTDIPCRACHVINDWEHPDPKKAKKRVIDAFAPSANPKRLSDPQRVETFLRLNCQLLMKRECTAREKGDVLAYLIGIEGNGRGELINVGRHQIGGIDDD